MPTECQASQIKFASIPSESDCPSLSFGKIDYCIGNNIIMRFIILYFIFIFNYKPFEPEPPLKATSKAKHLSLAVDVTSHVELPRRGNLSGSRFPRVTLLPAIVGAGRSRCLRRARPLTVVKPSAYTDTLQMHYTRICTHEY